MKAKETDEETIKETVKETVEEAQACAVKETVQ